MKTLVERQIRDIDEMIAVQLHALLQCHGYTMTLKTVLRCRTALGWTFRGSASCQLIRQQNIAKRLQWAQEHLRDGFDNMIWTDESSVQMERISSNRAQRSSCNRARIVLYRFIQR